MWLFEWSWISRGGAEVFKPTATMCQSPLISKVSVSYWIVLILIALHMPKTFNVSCHLCLIFLVFSFNEWVGSFVFAAFVNKGLESEALFAIDPLELNLSSESNNISLQFWMTIECWRDEWLIVPPCRSLSLVNLSSRPILHHPNNPKTEDKHPCSCQLAVIE